MTSHKFMIAIRDDVDALLQAEADLRGITRQELIRAVIVPEWARRNPRFPKIFKDLPKC